MSLGNEVLSGSKRVRRRANLDRESASGGSLETSQTTGAVSRTTGGTEEFVVSRCGDVDEGGSGVDDGVGGSLEGGAAVSEASSCNSPVAERNHASMSYVTKIMLEREGKNQN